METSFHTLYRIKKNDTELELWSINKSDFFKDFRIVANIGFPFCIVGLIGNGILFWLFCCTIKKSRFTIYVANLATGDFIILLHYFVAYLLIFLPSHASFYSQHVKVISLLFGSGTNIYFLTAISVERYLMVSSPDWFQSHRPKHLTVLVCVILWTLSFILTMIEYFFCHPRYLPSHIIGFLYCHTAIVLQYIINYIIFVPVMILSTLALFIKMKNKPPQNLQARLDISIVATVFLHLLLSTFIKIAIFIHYLAAFMLSSQYRRASLILDCMDATINPFVYLIVGCWKRENVQEPFHMLLDRALKDDLNSNQTTQPDQERA
ncbi:proto-oncogene Mas-like [Eublepharis macularius]|uniref:Proto-oncogene Mas-like n=1 Tax=Eublepharis macularius TaxID=481883 RepID=A0AA97J4R0_EUBMA|nr:proto-oncogene Mas-like [Eublepharis macularius]